MPYFPQDFKLYGLMVFVAKAVLDFHFFDHFFTDGE